MAPHVHDTAVEEPGRRSMAPQEIAINFHDVQAVLVNTSEML